VISNAEKTAATLFRNQQYKEAAEIWKGMVGPKSNAGLYFNIGLAESKLDHQASAIYAFEQALRICPLNSTYSKALETERKKDGQPCGSITLLFFRMLVPGLDHFVASRSLGDAWFGHHHDWTPILPGVH
jgi:tetratricopeptide (TPR) repeat protein